MFSFVVKHFGFLKSIPLLAHLFDSYIKMWMFITNSKMLDSVDEIEREVLMWDGIVICLHKYGGIQFNFNGIEIGHIHSNGILDILFSRKIKEQLMAEGRIKPHHVFSNSGWISFYIKNQEDKGYAKELLRMSYSLLKVKG